MTKRVNLAFSRSGTYVMSGGASVDVDDNADWEAVEAKARRGEFAEYLPLDLDFSKEDEDWDFELIENDNEEQDDS